MITSISAHQRPIIVNQKYGNNPSICRKVVMVLPNKVITIIKAIDNATISSEHKIIRLVVSEFT